ncbi:MAG: type II secretion system minor pseudopilin GspJ [Legionellales bacterium]|nr:type II secretion system minor pseudopilin GspJ [Legionellales bacterium]
MNTYSFQRHNGFTLIEIIIALLIFAIIASILMVVLEQSIATQEDFNHHAETLSSLQWCFYRLENDLTQVVDRPIKLSNGKIEPALSLSIQPFLELQLTRLGVVNPLAVAKRSIMQRVVYQFNHHQLWRLSFSTLDRDVNAVPNKILLLDGLDSFHLTVLDQHNKWLSSWPFYSNPDMSLPKAVKVTLCLQPRRCIDRIFSL